MAFSRSAREGIALATFTAISVAAGWIGSLVTDAARDGWYDRLAKPPWTPPDWVFAPVWTLLYLLIGLAAWLVWREQGVRRAAFPLLLWVVQLALNTFWVLLFFGMRSPGAALLEIVVLWAAILATMAAFARVSRTAALLLVPYLLWVGFAAVLNYAIWRLNLPARG